MKDIIKKILREETSDMKDIIFDMINNAVEGVDVYKYKGDLWLIFTDSEQWVIRLTERGDLHYQYNFFQDIFKYFSMGVVENQHYITEWVEDTIKNGVRLTLPIYTNRQDKVEDTIQNGVRYTVDGQSLYSEKVEDTIKNGIKLNKS